ncbi:MAG: TraB/GumN family protein [Eubacteriales bacterium]|jgi:pheromone shutdown-related protein TraB|nr:TraB/GumN family protein [Eubacteriales bacterium]
MEDNIVRLEYRGKEIILVATAHVLKQSADLIRKVIHEEQPDSVCVELDEGRYQSIQNPKAWENTDIIQVIKSKKIGFLLANLILGSYQKRIAKGLDTVAGQEMLEGINSAKETGAQLVLADRKIQTTFTRIWRKLNLWDKGKLLFDLLLSSDDEKDLSNEDISNLLKTDVLASVTEQVRGQFPKIAEILISERDQYLAYKIKEAPGKKVVAVLGAAHVPGVREEIFKTQDIVELSAVPVKYPLSRVIPWAIPMIIIGLLIYSFIVNIATGMRQLSSWALWNGLLAAAFTALSFGHPLSILTSLVAAPFTSLNPLIACGWLTGLVEATIRRPTVQDINNIPRDIFSSKYFFKNRFLKVLLIVIMANIGSSIGSFVAGLDIIKNLI